MKVRLTFLEPVLGTWPSNENIARDFIASKAPDASTIEDEIAALGADAVAEKGKTVFPRTDGRRCATAVFSGDRRSKGKAWKRSGIQ